MSKLKLILKTMFRSSKIVPVLSSISRSWSEVKNTTNQNPRKINLAMLKEILTLKLGMD